MRAFVRVLLVVALALGVNAWLIHRDLALDVLTPSPEMVVQTFALALATGRPDLAARQLVERERGGPTHDALAGRSRRLRARWGDFSVPPGGEARRDGDRAVYLASIQTEREGRVPAPFRLARQPDTRLWRIVGFRLP